ncbi:PrsW family intramembrane metalloprotease [Haloarcula hispanica]|uniref:PrsW family intramembrane metalloprotease n=1 Tax=Haloarcula hispanica TaxID=51589 RepID=A0A482TEM7_HALHI|nr:MULTISPECIES: PrsW family glutamic-type intramembrane protease [Haloarcula]MCJ0620086.1 PrsW family intramembrane metalloprotease [Haloarcula hispanica]MUV49278.1 PrsW family intramembrane metalloprotease [Haloarcula sp. CBA1122]RYJ10519.1 PrsW family intramembrane metalloprotease [Haloarcula hispanica]
MGKRRQDPVEVNADGSADLYEISTWEPRSRLDRFAHWLYHIGIRTLRYLVILAAILILLLQVAFGSLGALSDQPLFAGMAILSAVPALGLAAYIYYADVTTEEPLTLLVGTFLLGVLFAGFAGILNGFLGEPVQAIGSGFGLVPFLGQVFVFFLIVGPVEETVKLLAVRLYAFRDNRFDAVVDGAVYGAVAGLGFATIENALYITQNAEMVGGTVELLAASSDITAIRALAGPGHVIYSAFAGYYLGLAKFNPDDAGPIVLKGLLIASLIHAVYNTLAGPVTAILAGIYNVNFLVAFFGFVIVYDSFFGLLLLKKVHAYRRAYRRAHEDPDETALRPEQTEFDP